VNVKSAHFGFQAAEIRLRRAGTAANGQPQFADRFGLDGDQTERNQWGAVGTL